MDEQNIKRFSEQMQNIFAQIRRDVIGQQEVVEGTIIAMIAGGNVLLEGVPGVGKTRLVRSLGRVFDLPFSRIQFTPDLMPADVTGTNIIVTDDKGNSSFRFEPGPIFSNIILADEINRATPKTQSALLEAMQEHKVTVMGVSRQLLEPFFVLATQNPIEQDGTYPLPEAQLDRFMFKLLVPNPEIDELKEIITMTQKTMDEVADKACTGEQLLEMRRTANEIIVSDAVLDYTTKLCSATHATSKLASEAAKKYLRLGVSPRAGQALISTAKVLALFNGRYNISYNDINKLVYPVFRHRIKLNFEAVAEHITPDEIITMILGEMKKEIDREPNIASIEKSRPERPQGERPVREGREAREERPAREREEFRGREERPVREAREARDDFRAREERPIRGARDDYREERPSRELRSERTRDDRDFRSSRDDYDRDFRSVRSDRDARDARDDREEGKRRGFFGRNK